MRNRWIGSRRSDMGFGSIRVVRMCICAQRRAYDPLNQIPFCMTLWSCKLAWEARGKRPARMRWGTRSGRKLHTEEENRFSRGYRRSRGNGNALVRAADTIQLTCNYTDAGYGAVVAIVVTNIISKEWWSPPPTSIIRVRFIDYLSNYTRWNFARNVLREYLGLLQSSRVYSEYTGPHNRYDLPALIAHLLVFKVDKKIKFHATVLQSHCDEYLVYVVELLSMVIKCTSFEDEDDDNIIALSDLSSLFFLSLSTGKSSGGQNFLR